MNPTTIGNSPATGLNPWLYSPSGALHFAMVDVRVYVVCHILNSRYGMARSTLLKAQL